MNQKPKRNAKLVRTIRQGIKELGLKEYEYRAIYERVTGKTNISDQPGQPGMNNKDLGRVIEALKKEGFNPSAPAKRDVSRCDLPQARKIRSLWLELKTLGELRDSSERALLTFMKKRIGVDRMEWADERQLQYIIEALKQWVDRVRMQKQASKAAAAPALAV